MLTDVEARFRAALFRRVREAEEAFFALDAEGSAGVATEQAAARGFVLGAYFILNAFEDELFGRCERTRPSDWRLR